MRYGALGWVFWFALWVPAHSLAQAPETERIAVAVVLVGHSDPTLQAHAKRVEEAISASSIVTLHADLQLHGIVSGLPLQANSAKHAKAAQLRLQLGRGEMNDAKSLKALGRLMGVATVAVVRRVVHQAELVMFDVTHGAFFDRFVKLPAASSTTVDSYVSRCTVASLQGLPAPPSPRTVKAANEADTQSAAARDQPGWLEEYWPVIACIVAVGALLTAYLVVENSSGQPETVIGFNVK